MKVDFTNFNVEPPDKGKAGGAPPAAAGGLSNSGDTGVDEASFSFDQSRVQSLQAQVLAQPEIRQSKVGPLQQAIESGNYDVPPLQVANALVAEFAGT